jgi:hypothetical protein
VADGGEVGRSVALSAATLVLAVDDVEHPMEGVLDAPMLALGMGELGGIGGDRGDVEAGLAGGRLARFLAHRLNHADAGEVGPKGVALLHPGDITDDPVAAGLDAAMIGIAGLMRGPACQGAIPETGGALLDEEIGDIAIEGRLVLPGLRRGRLLSAGEGAVTGAGLGRAPLSRGQEFVPPQEAALPRPSQEHRAVAHPVRAGQPGDCQENAARAGPGLITPGVCLDPVNNAGQPKHNTSLCQLAPLPGAALPEITPRPPKYQLCQGCSVFP